MFKFSEDRRALRPRFHATSGIFLNRRIEIKISFIKIAGVFGRGESTGAMLAVRINKRHAAGMELITLIMKNFVQG